MALVIIYRKEGFKRYVFGSPSDLNRVCTEHIGYTIYDLVVMLNKPYEHISMYLHHVFGVLGCIGILVNIFSYCIAR